MGLSHPPGHQHGHRCFPQTSGKFTPIPAEYTRAPHKLFCPGWVSPISPTVPPTAPCHWEHQRHLLHFGTGQRRGTLGQQHMDTLVRTGGHSPAHQGSSGTTRASIQGCLHVPGSAHAGVRSTGEKSARICSKRKREKLKSEFESSLLFSKHMM